MVGSSVLLEEELDEAEDDSVPVNVSSGDVGATSLRQSYGGTGKDKGRGILKEPWTRQGNPLSSSDPALRASMRGKKHPKTLML